MNSLVPRPSHLSVYRPCVSTASNKCWARVSRPGNEARDREQTLGHCNSRGRAGMVYIIVRVKFKINRILKKSDNKHTEKEFPEI